MNSCWSISGGTSTVSSCAIVVYTIGFIGMYPKLYVDYCLKSVTHCALKIFMYKNVNTFMFVFLIHSPLRYKLMTLRNDVVFVVCWYIHIYQLGE